MVAGTHYFATELDQFALLDYLGEPSATTLHPFPFWRAGALPLSRSSALSAGQVMMVNSSLDGPITLRAESDALEGGSRAAVFNRMNLEREQRTDGLELVDSNASPVLFWRPGQASSHIIALSELGSQADSMSSVSAEYARWVKRSMKWIRSNGIKVWGLEMGKVRPDLAIRLTTVSTVYALPNAMTALEAGATGQ